MYIFFQPKVFIENTKIQLQKYVTNLTLLLTLIYMYTTIFYIITLVIFAVWLILAYHLLEDTCKIDIIIAKFFFFFFFQSFNFLPLQRNNTTIQRRHYLQFTHCTYSEHTWTNPTNDHQPTPTGQSNKHNWF